MKLKKLNEKEDGLLLLEFRQTYWEQWVAFCKEHGYESEVGE